jgi:hypothetical protein
MNSLDDTPTHRRGRITINAGRPNERDGGAYAVHKSRCCANCTHHASQDPEADAAYIAEFGSCLNLCTAADAPDPDDRWCDAHQTRREFERGLHRPELRVLLVVSVTGEAGN